MSVTQRFGRLLMTAAAVLIAAGCQETEMTLWLNPDGSGRITIETPTEPLLFETTLDTRRLEDRIAKVIDRASGVEAWRDITLERTDQGGIRFRGTAFFRDIQQLDFPTFNRGVRFEWREPVAGMDGRLDIRLRAGQRALDWSDMTDDDVAGISSQQIQAWRSEHRFALGLLVPLMTLAPVRVTMHLPGRITRARHVEPVDTRSARYVLDPFALVEQWGRIINDDTMMARVLLIEKDAQPGSAAGATLEMAFDAIGSHSVSIASETAPLFDYDAELETAMRMEPVMWETLGSEQGLALPVTRDPAGVQMLGAIWHRPFERDGDGRWTWRAPACRVYLQAELNDVPEGRVQAWIRSARCPAGQPLIAQAPARLSPQQITSSPDRRAVLLTVDLTDPAPGTEIIADLEGTVEFRVAGGTRSLDLGFNKLAAGETGNRFNARIDRLLPGIWADVAGQILRFEIDRRAGIKLHAIAVVTPDGRRLPCTWQHWAMASQRGYSVMLREGGDFPRDASLVLDVREPSRVVEIPFAFSDIAIQSGAPKYPK